MSSQSLKTRSVPNRCRFAGPACRAFTLIEAMAVIVVLAILAVVATAKYIDFRAAAAASAESATVGAIREAVSHYRLNAAIAGSPALPETLDQAAANAVSAPATPFFGGVLSTPIIDGWRKGANASIYIGPAGNTYVYDSSTGQFSGIGATVPGARVSTTTPVATIAMISVIVNGNTLSGTELVPTKSVTYLGVSYEVIADQVIADQVTADQAIAAGDYTLNLETQIADYDSQLNYWAVYAVADGVEFKLTNGGYYGSVPDGMKLLTQDYIPPAKSNEEWFAYINSFTVTVAADVAGYTSLVVVMTKSKADGQSLEWRNVVFMKK